MKNDVKNTFESRKKQCSSSNSSSSNGNISVNKQYSDLNKTIGRRDIGQHETRAGVHVSVHALRDVGRWYKERCEGKQRKMERGWCVTQEAICCDGEDEIEHNDDKSGPRPRWKVECCGHALRRRGA